MQTLHAVPPSSTHLFEENALPETLKQNGGFYKKNNPLPRVRPTLTSSVKATENLQLLRITIISNLRKINFSQPLCRHQPTEYLEKPIVRNQIIGKQGALF